MERGPSGLNEEELFGDMLTGRREGSRPLTTSKEGRIQEASLSQKEKEEKAADLYREFRDAEIELAKLSLNRTPTGKQTSLVQKREDMLFELNTLGYSRSEAALAFDRLAGPKSDQAGQGSDQADKTNDQIAT